MGLQEFQAVIMAAGRGTRLPELVGESSKFLLPIGRFPLLWYPINILQQHQFQEVIIIVLESEKTEIQQALERSPLKIKLDFVAIPSDSDFGTADSLRFIHDKIKSDFIVLSGDVVTNVSFYPLFNKFRQHNASVAALFFKSGFESNAILPGPKSKHKPERDLIGIHPDSQRLLFLASTSDFEDVLMLNAHLLRKNEKMIIYSRLVDSHIYVMKKWVMDVLNKKKNMSTLKGEFLPYLIKKQMYKKPGAGVNTLDTHSEVGMSIKPEDDIFQCIPHSAHDQEVLKTSLYNDSRSKEPYSGDLIRCYAIEAPKECVGVRINTTLSFIAICQKLYKIWPDLCGKQAHFLISPNAIVNSTQTKDIAVADNAKLSEKTSLTCCVFGYNSTVSPKNIIKNTVLLANSIVEEGCNIENSIIGYKAVVKKGSVLQNCVIGPSFIVEEGSKEKMQHLTNADGFMEIDIQ